MRFKCIKSIEDELYKKDSVQRFPFISGKFYKINTNCTTRTNLELFNESGMSYGIAEHWLWWKLNK